MFRPNPAAQAELKADPRYRRALRQAADSVVRHARAIAPDGGPGPGYRETLRVTADGDDVRAESTDAFAHLIEFGSANNPPYAPLRRAVRAAGLTFRDTERSG